jgi:acetolactate synthase-1/2/3 large subunit
MASRKVPGSKCRSEYCRPIACITVHPDREITAVQYQLPVIVIVVDNGMYGTIRMHQERHYPGRVVATDLRNPDFAAYARAFGGYGVTIEKTADFIPAFQARCNSIMTLSRHAAGLCS